MGGLFGGGEGGKGYVAPPLKLLGVCPLPPSPFSYAYDLFLLLQLLFFFIFGKVCDADVHLMTEELVHTGYPETINATFNNKRS